MTIVSLIQIFSILVRWINFKLNKTQCIKFINEYIIVLWISSKIDFKSNKTWCIKFSNGFNNLKNNLEVKNKPNYYYK